MSRKVFIFGTIESDSYKDPDYIYSLVEELAITGVKDIRLSIHTDEGW